jgi:hypothetical protein
MHLSLQALLAAILSSNPLTEFGLPPNPSLKPDPASLTFRSLSTSRFLASIQRFGAGEACGLFR